MKLGVAGLVSEWSKIDRAAADRVRSHGFRGVSVFFSKPLEAELTNVQNLHRLLADAGLDAAQANGAYEALVNPNDHLRAEGIRGLTALVRCGRVLDASTVYVRPGGLNPRGHWYAHPENHTPQTFDRLVQLL
jgi:sugar phosphate isomerase/epimerase